MGKFFTYCWQHSEVLRHRDGEPVGFAYGSQFARRGVCPDDEVYIVSVHRGRVHLLGKMRIGAVTCSAEDCRHWAGADLNLPPATEYLLAEACTPARLVPLPDEVARSLRFVRGKEGVGLAFRAEGLVDPQCLRGVRRLSAESAAALDGLLPALEPYRPGEAAGRNEGVGKETGPKAVRGDGSAANAHSALPARPPKTHVRVRKPNEVRFLSGTVKGVWVVVNLHKPGVYRHDNRHVAEALRALASAIERAGAPLADQDVDLEFDL